MADMSRREFLEKTAVGTAAAGVAAVASAAPLRAEPLGLPLGSQTYPEKQMVVDGKFPELLKNFYAAGIRQIELCSPGYREFKSLADGKATKKLIEDNGLTCISAHFTGPELKNTQGQAIEWAQTMGLTQMGTAGLPGRVVGGVTSLEEVKRAADDYNKIAANTRKAGLQQFLHNETLENSKLNDGRLTYPVLLEYLDPDLVKMQFQMSAMRTIGDPIMYFTLYPGRFISAHVHGVDLDSPMPPARGMTMPVKQPGGAAAGGPAGRGRGAAPQGPPGVAVGDDSVDWPRVFAAAKIGGLKNYFIEQEQPGNGWELMVKSAAYLKTLT